jgi:hypothetical protein
MNKVTEQLLQELDASPTDLAKLVRAVLHKHRGVLAISADTITRWERDDPRSWSLVRQWLTLMGVKVLTEKRS